MRRHRAGAAALAGSPVLIALVAAACGLGEPETSQGRDPAFLVTSAAEAIATTPGVRYSLSIDSGVNQGGIDSEGQIDFERRRFAGTANGGQAGESMLLFGGPTNGALILADGLFVQTEGGPWEMQPDQTVFFHPLIDRAGLSEALGAAFAEARVDPAIRFAPCGPDTCQVVGLVLPDSALLGLSSFVFGDRISELPPDLAPVEVDLSVHPSGFPVQLDARLVAGTTITAVRLKLARLDPAPAIAPPIP